MDELLFTSDMIRVYVAVNSILFQHYQIIIVEKENFYIPLLIIRPGKAKKMGRYSTLKGAKIAVLKKVKKLCIKENTLIKWTKEYDVYIDKIQYLRLYLEEESLELKIRMILLKKMGRNAFLIEDYEDIRKRHFFMAEDEKELQGIIDNFGVQIDVKEISPLSIENLVKTFHIKRVSSIKNRCDSTQKSSKGRQAVFRGC